MKKLIFALMFVCFFGGCSVDLEEGAEGYRGVPIEIQMEEGEGLSVDIKTTEGGLPVSINMSEASWLLVIITVIAAIIAIRGAYVASQSAKAAEKTLKKASKKVEVKPKLKAKPKAKKVAKKTKKK